MHSSALRSGYADPRANAQHSCRAWPAQGDWMMEPKWDGFRLLAAIDRTVETRAWSRRGASLGDRLGSLLEPLAASLEGRSSTLNSLRSRPRRHGRSGLRHGMPSRASRRRRRGQEASPGRVRSARAGRRKRPWTARGPSARSCCGRASLPANGCGRPSAAGKPRCPRSARHARVRGVGSKATWVDLSPRPPDDLAQVQGKPPRHRHTQGAATGRDGHTYAISELDGQRVTTLASPKLAALIGQQVELAYSRTDADGSLRGVRISRVDLDPRVGAE